MVDVADIRKDLPSWPDDVIEQWLHYFANEPDCGWPPPDPLGDHRWGKILGGRPLSWWREVTWNTEKIKCELSTFSPKTHRGVTEIMAEILTKQAIESTKRRVDHAYTYIMDNATFPRQLVTMRMDGGLSILDGSHRMAAFEMLQRTPDAKFAQFKKQKAALEQNVWIGTHKSGEVPLS
jgi:hypothetical protein